MRSILAALDRRCDVVLSAWYKDEESDGWRSLGDGEKSAARSLLRMMENVFRMYYDGMALDGSDPDGVNYGERIADDYLDCWDRFIADIQAAVANSTDFNGICPTLYLRMHFTKEDVVVDETTLRPCAIGRVFLERALFHVCAAVIEWNKHNLTRRGLRIKSLGIRGRMVEDALSGTNINNTGYLGNEWFIQSYQLSSVMQKLAEKSSVPLDPATGLRVPAKLVPADELNLSHSSVERDKMIAVMIGWGRLTSGLLHYAVSDDTNGFFPLLKPTETNLLVYKEHGRRVLYSFSQANVDVQRGVIDEFAKVILDGVLMSSDVLDRGSAMQYIKEKFKRKDVALKGDYEFNESLVDAVLNAESLSSKINFLNRLKKAGFLYLSDSVGNLDNPSNSEMLDKFKDACRSWLREWNLGSGIGGNFDQQERIKMVEFYSDMALWVKYIESDTSARSAGENFLAVYKKTMTCFEALREQLDQKEQIRRR